MTSAIQGMCRVTSSDVKLTSFDAQGKEGKERARAAVRETEQANEEVLKGKQQQREQERQADAQIAGHCHGTPSSSCMQVSIRHSNSDSVISEMSHLLDC